MYNADLQYDRMSYIGEWNFDELFQQMKTFK